jgi:recombination protein RecR
MSFPAVVLGLPSEVGDVALLLGRFPGIGAASALKLATLFAQQPDLGRDLEEALCKLREGVGTCPRCNFLAKFIGKRVERCHYCQDKKRDNRLLCVVERVRDVTALERGGTWRGQYFVLGTLISPLENVSAEALPLAQLIARIRDGAEEVLLATPSTTDGDATALVVARWVAQAYPDGGGPDVSRLAKGVGSGADLSYADPITIGQAVGQRSTIIGGG